MFNEHRFSSISRTNIEDFIKIKIDLILCTKFHAHVCKWRKMRNFLCDREFKAFWIFEFPRDLYSPPTAPPRPPTFAWGHAPKPGERTVQNKQKNFKMFQSCIKSQKSSKRGEKMGKKSIFNWYFVCKFESFLKEYYFPLGFSPIAERFTAGFPDFF